MTYSCVFFDLDGTLWDFEHNSKVSLSENYQTLKYERFFNTFDQFFELYHTKNRQLWELYREGKIKKNELNKERFLFPLQSVGINNETLAHSFGEKYLELLTEQTILLPNAKEILEYLKPKYKLFILSNGFEEIQFKKLKKSNLNSFFENIILSDQVGSNKPNLRIFNYAVQRANANKKQCIMIGDEWEADIIGAKNAGIDQVYYNVSNQQKKEKKATFEIKNLLELKSIL